MLIYMLVFLLIFGGCATTAVSGQHYTVSRCELPGNDVKVGMSSNVVLAKWGVPNRIIKYNRRDRDETWIYKPNWKIGYYLDFKDGILVKFRR